MGNLFTNLKTFTMLVYEVISTNLDINDGEFCNVLFADLDSAKEHCRKELEGRQAKEIVEDFEGILAKYQDKSLEYTVCKGKPAIYYKSHYGNYNMVVFVKSRTVH